MANTKTSWLSSGTLEGLRDELHKISAAKKPVEPAPPPPPKDVNIKKYLKATAIIAAGAGVGTGLGMVADKALQKAFGPRWDTLNKGTQMRVAGAALGLASAAYPAFKDFFNREREKATK